MKTLRRIVQIFCTLLMALSLTAVPIKADGSNTITITTTDGEHDFKAYQIFSGTITTEGTGDSKVIFSDVAWGSGIDETSTKDASTFNSLTGLTKETAAKNLYGVLQADTLLVNATSVPDFKDADSAEDVALVISKYTEADVSAKLQEIARIFEVFKSGTVSNTSDFDSGSTSDKYYSEDTKTHTLHVGDSGYYLVLDETGSSESGSDTQVLHSKPIMLAVNGNASAKVKGTLPTLEKKVYDDSYKTYSNTTYGEGWNDVADASIGDMVEFRLIGTFPDDATQYKNKEGNLNYKWIAYDTFGTDASGNPVFDAICEETTSDTNTTYTLKENADVKVYISKDKNTEGNAGTINGNLSAQAAASPDYIDITSMMTTVQENGKTYLVFENTKSNDTVTGFTMQLTAGGNGGDSASSMATMLSSYKYIIVDYKLKLNSYAKVGSEGNLNTAKLKYSNNYYNTEETDWTPDDKTIVYTYKLNGTKVDGDNNKKLQNAKFNLYRTTGTTGTSTKEYATVNSDKITGWVSESDDNKSSYGVVTSNAEGKFSFAGLDAGTYYLEETTAPTHYNKLKDPVTVEIISVKDNATELSGSVTSLLTSLSVKVNDEETSGTNGEVSITVANYKGVTLPSTGGEGISKLLYIAGGIMVVVTGVYLISKRRADALK